MRLSVSVARAPRSAGTHPLRAQPAARARPQVAKAQESQAPVQTVQEAPPQPRAVSDLTKSEAEALAIFTDGRARLGLTEVVEVLQEVPELAGTSNQVSPEVVEGALVCLDRLALGATVSALTAPTTARPSPAGRWHLLFSTATKLRGFQYIPVREEFVVDLSNKTVALESELGPLRFNIRGEAFGWEPSTRALDFQFKEVDIYLFGTKLMSRTPKTEAKTYWFYYDSAEKATCPSGAAAAASTTRIAAAVSSAGGRSLLVHMPDGKSKLQPVNAAAV